MSFLGMGPIEILVVLLLAFVILGPERMVDVARKLGKLVAEVRQMVSELPDIVMDEDPKRPPEPTPHIVPRGTGANLIEEQTNAADAVPADSEPTSDTKPNINDAPNGVVPHQRVRRQKLAETPTPEASDADASPDRE